MSHASESLVHGAHEGNLNPLKVGMITFLASDSAFFATLIMVYLYNLGKVTAGPYSPGDVLSLPLALPG